MMNTPRRRRWSPNARLLQQDIAKTSELLDKFENFFTQMDLNMATMNANVAIISGRLDIIPSKMDAIQYKIDEFQRNVISLQDSIYDLEGMQYTVDPLIHTISAINGTIHSEFFDLQQKINAMKSIIKDLDEISKDPVINRTIEDLKEVSDRF